jgi:hypothetical protein
LGGLLRTRQKSAPGATLTTAVASCARPSNRKCQGRCTKCPSPSPKLQNTGSATYWFSRTDIPLWNQPWVNGQKGFEKVLSAWAVSKTLARGSVFLHAEQEFHDNSPFPGTRWLEIGANLTSNNQATNVLGEFSSSTSFPFSLNETLTFQPCRLSSSHEHVVCSLNSPSPTFYTMTSTKVVMISKWIHLNRMDLRLTRRLVDTVCLVASLGFEMSVIEY